MTLCQSLLCCAAVPFAIVLAVYVVVTACWGLTALAIRAEEALRAGP